jgi:hypothetical protein
MSGIFQLLVEYHYAKNAMALLSISYTSPFPAFDSTSPIHSPCFSLNLPTCPYHIYRSAKKAAPPNSAAAPIAPNAPVGAAAMPEEELLLPPAEPPPPTALWLGAAL